MAPATTGRRPADQGRVVMGGRDLYGSDEGLGRRIGFVPQDDPVEKDTNADNTNTTAGINTGEIAGLHNP